MIRFKKTALASAAIALLMVAGVAARADDAGVGLQALGDRPIGGVVGGVGDFQAGRDLGLRRRQILLRHIERLEGGESGRIGKN